MSALREKNTNTKKKNNTSGKKLTRKLSEVNIDKNEEVISVENVLKELDLPNLKLIAKEKNVRPFISRTKRDDHKAVRQEYSSKVAELIKLNGYRNIFNSFPFGILSQVTEHMDLFYLTSGIELLEDENDQQKFQDRLEFESKDEEELKKTRNGLSCVLLAKRCFKKIERSSLESFMEALSDECLLDLLTCILGGEEELLSKDNRIKILHQIYEEFDAISMKNFFEGLSYGLLKNICYQMYIIEDLRDGTTFSKKILAECIVYGFSYDKIETEEVEIERESSKKPKQIDGDITKADLIFHYKVDELKKFLKEKELISTGRKSELVNRIIFYFEDTDAAVNKFNVQQRKENRKNRRRSSLVVPEEEENSFESINEDDKENEASDREPQDSQTDSFLSPVEDSEEEKTSKKVSNKKTQTKNNTAKKNSKNSKRTKN